MGKKREKRTHASNRELTTLYHTLGVMLKQAILYFTTVLPTHKSQRDVGHGGL